MGAYIISAMLLVFESAKNLSGHVSLDFLAFWTFFSWAFGKERHLCRKYAFYTLDPPISSVLVP